MKIPAIIAAVCVLAQLLLLPPALAEQSDKDAMKARHQIEDIDLTAKNTLEQLMGKSPTAKELLEKCYGYAVFDNLKLAFGLSGGAGSGVAVEPASGARTYMKMGTAGIGFGIGGQKYQVVFLFEAEKPFRDFVDKGWKADAAANAAVWDQGANVQARFVNGLAVYQLTDKGLMLQADISGTKFWKDDKLNKHAAVAGKADETEEKQVAPEEKQVNDE